MKRLAATLTILVIAVLLVVGVIWLSNSTDTVGHAPDPTPPASAGGAGMPSPPGDAFAMTVESVHDGDTLRAYVDEPNEVVASTESTRVRLLGIDTPEISPPVECWGDEATEQLIDLAPPGSTVWAAADVDPFDQYGRTLLYLWTDDGEFINAALVAGGSARVEVYDPNDEHEQLLRTLEAEAQGSATGRWGACD